MKRTIAMDAPRRGSRCVTIVAALALILPVSAPPVFAQTPVPAASADAALSPEELEKLVDRIALYPDDLVALILPASTNPLQIVQAERFLAKRKTDPKTPIDDKWDDSVKSLVNYPEVIASMSADLDWTAALGEAVVADQGEVLQAVQAFRRKTQAVGNLKSDAKQTVVVEKEVITIVPTDPQVVYVPQYNPTTVVVSGGYSAYGYYPTPYPSYYYPYAPGAALATGLIWGAAIGAVWGGNRYGANYGGGNNNININNNTNINTGNRNTNTGNRGGQGGGSSQWKSNKTKGQVSKSVGANPPARTGDRAGGGAGDRGGAGGGDRAGGGAGDRGVSSASTRQGSAGGGDRGAGGASAGDRGAAGGRGGSGGAGGGAFDGYSSGRQTDMNSSRGASSRSSASPSSGRSSASPSSNRGGGGGGGRGGGGGGGRGGGGRR